MRCALWPESTPSEQEAEACALISGETGSGLPSTLLVAENKREVVGFAEVGLRSHADGCDPTRPVGFLEGWYVQPEARRSGVGRMLVRAAERWARANGAVEMASDTWIDSEVSIQAHASVGFEEVYRNVFQNGIHYLINDGRMPLLDRRPRPYVQISLYPDGDLY
jgi:aminoglycoside 6'-N-acetyltransferase I